MRLPPRWWSLTRPQSTRPMMPATLATATRIEPSASVRPAPWLRSSARKATSAYCPVTIRQPQAVSMSRLRLRPTCGSRLRRAGAGEAFGAQAEQRERGQRRHARGDGEAPAPARQRARSRAGWRPRRGRRPGCPSAGCRARSRGDSAGTRAGRGGRRPAWSSRRRRPRARAAARRPAAAPAAATSTITAVASPPTSSVRCSPSRSAATPAAYAPTIRPSANEATIRPVDERREAEIQLDEAGQREDALVDQGDAELHPHREPENRSTESDRPGGSAPWRLRRTESPRHARFGGVRGSARSARLHPRGASGGVSSASSSA